MNALAANTLQYTDQIKQDYRLQRYRQQQRSNAVRSSIAAIRADSGLGGETTAAFDRVASIESAVNASVLDRNESAALGRAASGAMAQRDRIASSVGSPLEAMLTGGLQGLQAGLNILGLVQALDERQALVNNGRVDGNG